MITVRDGAESGGGTLLARYCNTHNSEVVMSSGESLVVELTTDDRKQRQGFAASFNFVKEYVNNVPNSKSTTVSPLLLPPASGQFSVATLLIASCQTTSHNVKDFIQCSYRLYYCLFYFSL